MNPQDLATVRAPTSYQEAEEILRRLKPKDADSVWAELTRADAEAILRSLAPVVPPPVPFLRCPTVVPEPPRIDSVDEDPEPPDGPRALPHLSEQTLLNVLETAPDAIVVIDSSGVIVLVNTQTETMFGYQRSELLGEKIEILVPIRNRSKHVGQRRGFFREPHIRAMGSRLPLFGLRKDGSEFPVEISLSPLQTEDGMLVTSAIRDVTERKEREARLAKAEMRYRSLVEGIPAVTFVAPFDEAVGELYVSPQIVDLLGFTQEEWLNDPVLWHRQLHHEDRERWHREFARTCATAEPFQSVYRFIARDGRVVWVHGEAKVVHDKDGRPLFLQGVAFDITRRKEAEEQLKCLTETLKDRVAEQTAELTRSNKELESFAHFTAHELKKPLMRISDVLHPSLRTRAKAPQSKRLSDIDLITSDMEKLIGEMLAYARVTEAARQFGSVDCEEVFCEVRATLKQEIEACGTLSIGQLPRVRGHRETLKHVFENLISNAIKYRARRRLTVCVSAELENGYWKFRVTDNGMGIEKHNRYTPHINDWERIFEPFERPNDKGPTGDRVAGHGIGLSYCRRAIEHHGGTIWVESERGKGSTFFFTLPATADATSPGPNEPEASVTETTSRKRQRRVFQTRR
jgi:PAS domain S-box-containing protein